MKIRLSAQGMSLNVEVPDDKAMTVYRGMAEKLLLHAGETGTVYEPKVVVAKPEKMNASEITEAVRVALETEMQQGKKSLSDPVLPSQEDDEDLPEEPAEENAPPQEPDMTDKPKGYKGFLMIRCKGCGHTRAFYSKYELNWYKCQECGEKTILEDLRLLRANCECGQRAYYYTNVDDPVTEANCLVCGAPVAVEWNAKKKCYQTIKEKQ